MKKDENPFLELSKAEDAKDNIKAQTIRNAANKRKKTHKKQQDDADHMVQELQSHRGKTLALARTKARQATNGQLSDKAKAKEYAQYRACVALFWDDARIVEETGWSLKRLQQIKREVRSEDVRQSNDTDNMQIFAEYELRQIQCIKELDDLAQDMNDNKAKVNAIRAKSDILDRMIRMGQELGVVDRATKRIEINQRLDIHSMSIEEIKVQLAQEMSDLQDLISPTQPMKTVAPGFRNLLPPPDDEQITIDISDVSENKECAQSTETLRDEDQVTLETISTEHTIDIPS